MADTPTDGTPETAAAPPPRRRAKRGTGTAATGKRKASTVAAAPAAKPATRRTAKRGPKPAPAAATIETKVKRAARSASTATGKAARQVKAKARAESGAAVAGARKAGFGKVFAVTTAAVLGLAAGAAALFGRRKIAKVSTDTVDKVMGRSEPEAAKVETPAAS